MLNKNCLIVVLLVNLLIVPQIVSAQNRTPNTKGLIDPRLDDTFTPVGYATFEDFGVKYFILGNFNSSLDDGGRLAFKFLSSTSTRFFYQTLKQYVVLNNPQSLVNSLTEELAEFYTLYKGEFVSGDHLAIDKDFDSVRVKLNGVILAGNLTTDLYQVLLNAWVGSVPPSRSFKGELLGQNDFSNTQSLFNTINYATGRREQVISFVQDPKKKALGQTNFGSVAANQPSFIKAAVKPNIQKPVLLKAIAAPKLEAPDTLIIEDQSQKQEQNLPEPKNTREFEERELIKQQEQNTSRARAEEEKAQKAMMIKANELERLIYTNKLMRHTRQNITYPRRAQQLNHQGQVVAVITIDKKGKMLDFELEEEAKYQSLNNAVEKGVKKSNPFPSMPNTISGDTFSFSLPITFAYN